MVGNDIIDLSLARAESNWQREGWIRKIFTKQEQAFLAASAKKELVVWLMWSMKEAAYKIYHRKYKEMFYAPQRFSCHDIIIKDGRASGYVCFHQYIYHTSSYVSSTFIHTIALADNNFDDVSVFIQDKTKLASSYRQPDNLLKDEYGIPYYIDDSGIKKIASRSHHGRFEAVVVAKT